MEEEWEKGANNIMEFMYIHKVATIEVQIKLVNLTFNKNTVYHKH